MTATTHTPNDMAALRPAHRRRDMSETNLQILRNLHVHGPQTPGDLARVMPTQQRSGITIALHVLAKPGYVMQDKTTKEPTWHITGTGRQRLAPLNDGLAIVPKKEKATSARRYLVEQHRLQARQRLVEQGTYHPEPFTDSARQGATDHEALHLIERLDYQCDNWPEWERSLAQKTLKKWASRTVNKRGAL